MNRKTKRILGTVAVIGAAYVVYRHLRASGALGALGLGTEPVTFLQTAASQLAVASDPNWAKMYGLDPTAEIAMTTYGLQSKGYTNQQIAAAVNVSPTTAAGGYSPTQGTASTDTAGNLYLNGKLVTSVVPTPQNLPAPTPASVIPATTAPTPAPTASRPGSTPGESPAAPPPADDLMVPAPANLLPGSAGTWSQTASQAASSVQSWASALPWYAWAGGAGVLVLILAAMAFSGKRR